jgi:hypothetical protein
MISAHHAAQSSPDGPGKSDLCQYVCETNSKPAGNCIRGWTERPDTAVILLRIAVKGCFAVCERQSDQCKVQYLMLVGIEVPRRQIVS